jgi:hypothetical protein
LKKWVDNTVDTAKEAAETALAAVKATLNDLAKDAETYVVSAADEVKATNMIDLMKAIELDSVYQASVVVTNDAMQQANAAPAALAGIEAGARMAAEGLMVGVQAVEQAGVWLGEWANAMQCELGMNSLLAALFAVNIVDPLPVEVAVTTLYLQGVSIAYLAAPSATERAVLGGACDLAAQYFLKMIWTLTTVQNAIGVNNQEVLQDAISMSVCKTLKKAPEAFTVPFSGAAIVAGVTINLATEFACRKRVPKGTTKWGDLKVYTVQHRYEGGSDFRKGKYSWSLAQRDCRGHGLTLCPRSMYCPNGPLQPPDGGMRNFNSWAPMGGEGDNMWINIGNQNPATELCKDHGESFKKERNPAWGNNNDYYDFKNSIYCCKETYVPKFEEPPTPITAKPTASPTTATPTAKPTTATPTTKKPTASPTTFAAGKVAANAAAVAANAQAEEANAAAAVANAKAKAATGIQKNQLNAAAARANAAAARANAEAKAANAAAAAYN